MNDPPGASSSLAIEAVDWLTEGGPNLTVRITGRWRRRRSEWRGPVLLVIEAQGKRHRFPAMPEPPSLTGALRGTWRMNFSVPAELAPHLGGRTWLQLGAAAVPLPEGMRSEEEPAPEPEPEPGPRLEPRPEPRSEPRPERTGVPPPARNTGEAEVQTVAARLARSSELALESATARASEAQAAVSELARRVSELEAELREARGEPARLRELLAQRDRERRRAEQRAHAERALRIEAEQALAARARADEDGEDELLEERIRELEDELEDARRQAAEAEHVAAAAEAARARARAQAEAAGARAVQRPRQPVLRPLAPEFALATLATQPPNGPLPGEPAAVPPGAESKLGLDAELRVRAATQRRALQPAIRPDLAARAERELAARAERELQLNTIVAELREEVGHLREALARENDGRVSAEHQVAVLEQKLIDQQSRSERIYDALEDLRDELDELRETYAAAESAQPDPAGPVEESNLTAALERLRESTPPTTPPVQAAPDEPQPPPAAELPEPPAAAEPPEPPEPAKPARGMEPIARVLREPAAATRPWLGEVFRALTAEDPTTAGRLLLALLPAQHEVYPLPVAYDLVLAGHATVRVTVGTGPPQIDYRDSPRPPGQVHFQVQGDLPGIARLMVAGRVRRRLGRHVARVRGDRTAANALRELLRRPMTLLELHSAGVRLDPGLALTLVALMIEPTWTAGERFALAHQAEPAGSPAIYLNVSDGSRPSVIVGTPPISAETTTVVCPGDALLPALAGAPSANVFVRGNGSAVELLVQWLQRAQSG